MDIYKDPICGMKVDVSKAKEIGFVYTRKGKIYYFCSRKCLEEFKGNLAWYRSETFAKIFPWVLGIVLVLGTVLSIAFDFMILYMGIFFIVFSLFKIIDWKGFVEAFSRYDLIGMNFRSYSWIYPAIEFFIGIGFLLHQFYSGYFLTSLAWVTLFIMGAGGIGVGVKLLKKEKFQCACLGTRINLPLTKVTLLEDVLMAGMSLIVIF